MKYYLSTYKPDDPAAYNLLKASLLQKLIRRGMVEEANYVAQLYLNDNQSKGLKRRLQIISAEDIGLGWSEASLFIEKEPDLIKITSALAQAPKNREADRFLLYIANNFNGVLNRGQDILDEAKSLQYIFKKTDAWYENKNAQNLKELKDVFSRLVDKAKNKEIVQQLCNNYLDLTRANIHGARCPIALAVLIAIRQLDKIEFNPDLTRTQVKPFDEIFDFAIDMHTPIGKMLKRDFNHWVQNCTIVIPEVTYPGLYDNKGDEKYPLTQSSNKFNK